MDLFGGIEAGGTKFVCAVGDANGDIQDKITIATTTPAETISKVIKYFQAMHTKRPLSALGVASFGPIDLEPGSKYYGYITTPPKTQWKLFDFVGTMRRALNLPCGWDTDVNGAALGEHYFGAAQDCDTFIYVTVGTGIGVGGMVSGKLMHGLVHPEMGHIFIPHDRTKDDFAGVCPFHGDCLEGLASGPAINKRWDVATCSELPSEHPAWDLETDYLAIAFANYTLMLSTQKIIVGGGVMRNRILLPKIRTKVQTLLNGYISHEKILNQMDQYIVVPGLGEQSGICGALALAQTKGNK